ncbi:N-acetylmuramoyl-L-alanine amidase family protein [Clostridiaceae bacterium 68-1-5]|uniref:N-acetylmuramoyl-L-alanine amidase family protein n=1 Tax=Suipraeoptans intestinalis TaxID=2606628 RepID=A0A6N7V0N7_9FIRM|nr:N-acetylmuramoyl-L-alanine amidase family protein [Suipraeoptans intestinalis]MDY3121375.1 N-acetylmuramoyl-L-alanine amidase family protein [Suipraeoptans intestinalis]MSR93426.1 N-acetylmuramoyl-L-alanine amidase family protein [Suipraeoptans intestinalis]
MRVFMRKIGVISMIVSICVSQLFVLAKERDAAKPEKIISEKTDLSEVYRSNEMGSQASVSGQWIKNSDGRWWYRHADGTYTRGGWEYIAGQWYLFDAAGWMLFGWQQVGGTWYYLGTADDGAMKTGWQKLGNFWYYLGDANDGSMKSGWQQIMGTWYYLGDANDGSMKSGWQQIRGFWYYLGDVEDGAMREECWVGPYYVGESGAWIPGYSETKTVKKVSVCMQYGSAESAQEKIETEEKEAVKKVTEYVRGLKQIRLKESSQIMGGNYHIRLDYTDGTYQRYFFSQADMEGNTVALSNGKYFHYQERDLEVLWKSLGGTIPEMEK